MPGLADRRDVNGCDDRRRPSALVDQPVDVMGVTLAKVAYSPVISEGLDFAGALFDRDGHLVACGDHDLTGLLGTLEPTLG